MQLTTAQEQQAATLPFNVPMPLPARPCPRCGSVHSWLIGEVVKGQPTEMTDKCLDCGATYAYWHPTWDAWEEVGG